MEDTTNHVSEVLVSTVQGDEITLEVLPSLLISDLKTLACERFGRRVASSHLLRGDFILTDATKVIDVVDSGSPLTLVVKPMVDVRRRVWMVPTLGYKGSGKLLKGLADEFVSDDFLTLHLDVPLKDQMDRIMVVDAGNADAAEDAAGGSRANPCVSSGIEQEAAGKPGEKGYAKGKAPLLPASADKCTPHGKDICTYDVPCTVCYLVPAGRPAETVTRTRAADPPRPEIHRDDCRADTCAQTAAEFFTGLVHEIVILVPSYWRNPSLMHLGPYELTGKGAPDGQKGKRNWPQGPWVPGGPEQACLDPHGPR